MEEERSNQPEQKERKKPSLLVMYSFFIFVIGYQIFGIPETILGYGIGACVRMYLIRKHPEFKYSTPVCVAVGVSVAVILAIILGYMGYHI